MTQAPEALALPAKPKMNEACNGCGVCCTRSLCAIAEEAYGPQASAPCPALRISHGRAWCGFVIIEPALGRGRPIAEALGIGSGCDAWTEETDG